MLAGRESLIRLIGKRKRTPSSQLSHHLKKEEAPSSSSDCKEPRVSTNQEGNGDDRSSEWVSCPVCGESIRGTDHIVNSHLDKCLTKGTKRKLIQRTLLQLNFSPISGNKTSLGVLDNPRVPEGKGVLIGDKESSTFKSCSFKNNKQSHFASNTPENHMSNSTKCTNAQMVSKVIEDAVNCKMPKDDACGVEDANFLPVIETFVVGRKFHDNVELQQGAGLSLLRDPQNAKDKNAIKVLSTDPGSGPGQMLGYLPRELAKFLSPLIDNHHLKCEGSVLSPPTSS